MPNWQDLEKKYYMHVFNRLPIVLVKGEGVRVWDENGKSYLDMAAGLAVNILGHAPAAVADAVAKQARTLIHTTNLYYTIPQLELAELLCEHSCADQVFFGNSGAEANEGAIKLARKYGKLNRNGAYEVISAEGSFHGRTLATIAATGQPKFQAPFAPMPDGFKHVPFNDLGRAQGRDDREDGRGAPRGRPGRVGRPPRHARVHRRRPGVVRPAGAPDDARRDPDGARPDGEVPRLRAPRDRAGRVHDGEGPRRGRADRRGAGDREGGGLHRLGPRLDLRREPARLRGGRGDAEDDLRAGAGRALGEDGRLPPDEDGRPEGEDGQVEPPADSG